MCTTIWTMPEGTVETQADFAKLVGVAADRLPLCPITDDKGPIYNPKFLEGDHCLCPIDLEKAMTDAGIKWRREDTGDYFVET